MTLRLDQLPASLRRRAVAAADMVASVPVDEPLDIDGLLARAAPNVEKPVRLGRRQHRSRCTDCGTEHTTWAAAERHADELGHHRIELVL